MEYAEAKALMEKHVTDPGLRKHCLASAAVMRGLAKKLGRGRRSLGRGGSTA